MRPPQISLGRIFFAMSSAFAIDWLLGYQHGASDKIYGFAVGSGGHFSFYGKRLGPGRLRVIPMTPSTASDMWTKKRNKGYVGIQEWEVPDFTSRIELGLFHDVFIKDTSN